MICGSLFGKIETQNRLLFTGETQKGLGGSKWPPIRRLFRRLSVPDFNLAATAEWRGFLGIYSTGLRFLI